ncbi:transposase [Streptomyces sp. NPDC057743]|uniref:transposase n=1 Tax=Streptomyces sp. NPDC057743 TaxID=3346236 RepID=UPI00368B8B90
MLPPIPKMGQPPRDRRQAFDGIWWQATTGSPWRDGLERYRPWETAYSIFRRRQIGSTWPGLLEELHVKADADGVVEWEVPIDAIVSSPHQHAVGVRKRGLTIRARRARIT